MSHGETPKFRGICRGLIEAHARVSEVDRGLGKFRGICRGLIEAAAAIAFFALSKLKFRGICRGLIEATLIAYIDSATSGKIPRHLPRPH